MLQQSRAIGFCLAGAIEMKEGDLSLRHARLGGGHGGSAVMSPSFSRVRAYSAGADC